jgi:hypothetical protein
MMLNAPNPNPNPLEKCSPVQATSKAIIWSVHRVQASKTFVTMVFERKEPLYIEARPNTTTVTFYTKNKTELQIFAPCTLSLSQDDASFPLEHFLIPVQYRDSLTSM